MATTTILQYLQNTGKSVTSGASVFLGTTPLDRLQTETFLTETAIVKGQVVALDVTKMATDATGGSTALTVIAADFNSATVQKLVVGVAQASVTGTATNPQPVTVIVRGPALAVPAVGAIAIGSPVILDPAGATGSCSAQVTVAEGGAATYQISEAFGFAMTAAAANLVNVYVLGKGI
jgi:hypothetical protein